MSQHNNVILAEQEVRIELPLQAYRSNQFKSLRRAAEAYNVPNSTLAYRVSGRSFRPQTTRNCRKLSLTEEHTIVQYILDLDLRGFSPRLCEIADMADKLLGVRGGKLVGMHWAERLISRSDELKTAFNRAKDRQRHVQKDSQVVGDWFGLVANVKAKYGIQDTDLHNFDESGFQMGVIGSMKVVTGSERRDRPEMVQPGDREWVTVIQGICAAGYAIPPFIIYKEVVHISAWYEDISIPRNWSIPVSENGWINNELGLAWLKHFDAHTKD